MTETELAELLHHCPTLYHMAERGSWPSIQRHGLLSTSALLDRCAITGVERFAIESMRRPDKVPISGTGFGHAVIRDQKPMDESGLTRCLEDGLTPQDWYRLLNGKVFFWLTPGRLYRLLEASPYRDTEHEVLEVEASALTATYRSEITLCAINSGNTKPFPAKRGRLTMLPIDDYPYASWRKVRPKGSRVVELAVTGGVPDILGFVRRVTVMRKREELAVLYSRCGQKPVNSQSSA